MTKPQTRFIWCCCCNVQGDTLEEFINHNKIGHSKCSGDKTHG